MNRPIRKYLGKLEKERKEVKLNYDLLHHKRLMTIPLLIATIGILTQATNYSRKPDYIFESTSLYSMNITKEGELEKDLRLI